MNALTKIEPAAEVQPDGLAKLRAPFPEHQVSKLPKPTKAQTDAVKADFKAGVRCRVCGSWHHPNVVHLDYVGHAALTDRLLDADPSWFWEPLAYRDGLPAFDASGGLWIRLTVCGVTRLGYGHAAAKPGQDPGAREKEVIGDALRNAGMRFGAALDLWHKGDLHREDADDVSGPSAEERAIAHLKSCAVSREIFRQAWESNKGGWKGVMDAAAYARVCVEMKRLAASIPEDAPPPKSAAPSDDADRFPGGGSNGVARNGGGGAGVPFNDDLKFGGTDALRDEEIPFTTCNFFAEPMGAVSKMGRA